MTHSLSDWTPARSNELREKLRLRPAAPSTPRHNSFYRAAKDDSELYTADQTICSRQKVGEGIIYQLVDEWSGLSEKEVQALLVQSLSRFFCCKEQCAGVWTDLVSGEAKNTRADILCTPLEGIPWKMGSFVVEVKPPGKLRHASMGDHIKQAMDYRCTNWKDYGRLPVFMFPGIAGGYSHCNGQCWDQVRRMLGSLGMGEIFMERATGKLSIALTAHFFLLGDKFMHNATSRAKAGMGIASAST